MSTGSLPRLSGFTVAMLRSSATLGVWALHLVFVYGWTALACARRFADAEVLGVPHVPLVVGVATVAALGVVLVLALRWAGGAGTLHDAGDETQDRFFRRLGLWVAVFSFVAIVWSALPAAVVPVCHEENWGEAMK